MKFEPIHALHRMSFCIRLSDCVSSKTSSDQRAAMRYYVYLIAFIISIVLAVVGGIAFRFLEVEHEARYAEIASKQLQKFLGQ